MVDVLKGNHRNKYPQKPELTVEKIGKQLRHSYKVKMASRAKGTNIQTEFQKKYQERRYLFIFIFIYRIIVLLLGLKQVFKERL